MKDKELLIFLLAQIIFISIIIITYIPFVMAQSCIENSDCLYGDSSAFCLKDDGNCEGIGMCADRPEIITTLYDPVCGCDGNTYTNSGIAALNGINTDYYGECVPNVTNPYFSCHFDSRTGKHVCCYLFFGFLCCN
jgi:hypothetical protein